MKFINIRELSTGTSLLMLGYGLVAGTRRIGRGYEFAISIEMGY
ncbi:MAG: hypothetical protein [Olavius algarvensis Gamma 1 endosymbiont]|nr:MAG: hypothetical protein [Olavius algarvensis Gamma 1 endosymbiont]